MTVYILDPKLLKGNHFSLLIPSAKWLNTRLDFKKLSSPPISKWVKKEFREPTYFLIAKTNITYLGVLLTKDVRKLNDKNVKSEKIN